jgi:hypothetical protein
MGRRALSRIEDTEALVTEALVHVPEPESSICSGYYLNLSVSCLAAFQFQIFQGLNFLSKFKIDAKAVQKNSQSIEILNVMAMMPPIL